MRASQFNSQKRAGPSGRALLLCWRKVMSSSKRGGRGGNGAGRSVQQAVWERGASKPELAQAQNGGKTKGARVGGMGERSRKERGEIAETAFLAKAVSMGFGVAKPWGERGRYDFIVDTRERLCRVQVKSAHRASVEGGYTIHAHGND